MALKRSSLHDPRRKECSRVPPYPRREVLEDEARLLWRRRHARHLKLYTSLPCLHPLLCGVRRRYQLPYSSGKAGYASHPFLDIPALLTALGMRFRISRQFGMACTRKVKVASRSGALHQTDVSIEYPHRSITRGGMAKQPKVGVMCLPQSGP